MVEGTVKKTQWSHLPIVFFEEDVDLLSFPHTDALVIDANIEGWTIRKILVDMGSSADIIFASTFDRMNIDRNLLQPVTFGDLSNPRTEPVTFDVVEMNYP